ncbi:MAG TPA: serine/threonine-protein kinase [Polyangiaceae bacterium]
MGNAPLKPGTIVAGRYRVEQQIGEGGMGAVYLVRHVRTDEMLALKLLHADVLKDATAVERFRREARAPAKMASEHVARVTDADTAPELGDAPFYVMEYLRGRDLEKTVTEEGPLSPALTVDYLRQASRALDKAHQLGIIHRDLKPENLFLTHRDDGTPCIKLLDFGIARLGDTGAVNPLKTQAGYIFGTPAFMSPEQALGDVALIGPPTDVWAFGLVAFKLLVGRDFWGEHPTARLCAMILSGPIPSPTERGSTFGAAFDQWFARCVARPVDERFRSTGEAAIALADALGVRLPDGTRPSNRPSMPPLEGVTEARPLSNAPPAEATGSAIVPPPSRMTTLVVLAACTCVVLAVSILFVLKSRSSEAAVSPQKEAVSVIDAGAVPSALAALPTATTEPSTETTSEPVPTASAPMKIAKASDSAAPAPSASAKPVATAPAGKIDESTLTRDQKHRLQSLQRLCDQGTFTPAECNAKRAEIARSP